MVTDDAKAAADGAKILVFMNPAFTHDAYLKKLEPYVTEGMVIFTIPCQPGTFYSATGMDIHGPVSVPCTTKDSEALHYRHKVCHFCRAQYS